MTHSALGGPPRKRTVVSGSGRRRIRCREVRNGGDDPRPGGGPLLQAASGTLADGCGKTRPVVLVEGHEIDLQCDVVGNGCLVTKDVAPRKSRLPDTTVMLVRAHIHIESKLREFIEVAAPAPEHLKFSDLDYNQTVRLALILGLDIEFKSALSAVGGLRNKFAHRLDASLGKAEAENLYAALGEQVKSVAQRSYATLLNKYPEKPQQMARLSPRDRVTLYLIAIRGGLIFSVAIAKGLVQ